MYYAKTWQEGNFEFTASVLAFDTRAARMAYAMQCRQRVSPIRYAEKVKLCKDGRELVKLLWDSREPTKFVRNW